MLTGTVAFSSSPWEEPHPCLARQSMMSLFPRAGWNWRLQRGLQVDLLGGGAPLGLPDHLPAAPPQCPPRNHLDKEPSQQWGRGWEGRELSKCDIWPRMVIILTDFWIFTKKLSIGDIFSHKNWCHLPLNSHESTKLSIKKSPKSVTIYSLKMSPKLVEKKSPKKVKILVNQQHFYKKNHHKKETLGNIEINSLQLGKWKSRKSFKIVIVSQLSWIGETQWDPGSPNWPGSPALLSSNYCKSQTTKL